MIEKFIKNDLTMKRWRRFRSSRRAMASSYLLLILIFLSVTSEFWANSKPIFMKFKDHYYFPVVRDYHPTEFNQVDFLVTDYRALKLGEDDFMIWPLVRWDPYESNRNVDEFPSPPSQINWMGTDDRGRDVLVRLLYGLRYSLIFSVLVWIFSYALGTVLGAFMGFVGGRIDMFGQRVTEVFESMPQLLILITLVSIFDASLELLVLFSVIFGWMMISIYMRAEFLRLRRREFVEGARAVGGSRFRQIFKHILPNSLGPLVTFSPFSIAGLISSLAILDYLGFGLPPPTPSWGELLQQAQKNFTVAWWLALFPSLAMFVTLVTLNLMGEGIRNAFDPRK